MNNQHPTNKIDNDRLYAERNNYFTGKYMTARDFRAEQNYLVSHHRWHHWNLHGWGIVWGLKVDIKDNQCLTIEPGLALDCHGRELLYSTGKGISIEKLESADSNRETLSGNDQETKEILIGLQYCEIPRHEVPLLLEDQCQPNNNAYNRIQETVRVCWKYKDEVDPCWTFPKVYEPAAIPQAIKDDRDPDECGCHHSVKIKSPCKCEPCGFVPLARLRYVEGSWKLDDLGCRYVPSPYYSEALTHIVGINWNHTGETNISELIKNNAIAADSEAKYLYDSISHNCIGLAIIKFDRALSRPLHCAGDLAEESNYFSQLLNLEYIIADVKGGTSLYDIDGDDFHPIAARLVVLSKCRKSLHCYFPAHSMQRVLPVLFRLKLNCDLLLDERGRAVDGDHIAGKVPNVNVPCPANTDIYPTRSGNGIEGGVFYSWTKLVSSGS